jgi:hypothetical protein
MGEEADTLLKGRVRIIKYVSSYQLPCLWHIKIPTLLMTLSIWRPLAKVWTWPLALCDARTVRSEDLVTCDIVRRRYIGETYFGKYNPDQKWYYFSDMDVGDVILAKVYDSNSEVEAKREIVVPAAVWVPSLTGSHRLFTRLL